MRRRSRGRWPRLVAVGFGKDRLTVHDMVDSGGEIGATRNMRSGLTCKRRRRVRVSSTLRNRLSKDGYLLLRGLLPREEVLQARATILAKLSESGGGLEIDEDLRATVMAGASSASTSLLSRLDIMTTPEVRRVTEHPHLFTFFESLFGKEAGTFGYKWLRGVTRGKFTGVHVDNVYVGRGSPHVHTAWIPMGDTSVEEGTLCVCPGSHSHLDFWDLQESYGQTHVGSDGTESGWLSDSPLTLPSPLSQHKWVSADLEAGDVIIINLSVVHMSTTNTTDRLRISCDSRWQPLDESLDPCVKALVSTPYA